MTGAAKPPILVSACLLGLPTRFDGCHHRVESVCALGSKFSLVPVCPEQAGGLPTPRRPAEIVDGPDPARPRGRAERAADRLRSGSWRVLTVADPLTGGPVEDVTAGFVRGAEYTVEVAKLVGARFAVLKARSPSCGSGEIYDGTFTGTLIPGSGVTAAALIDAGLTVLTEGDVERGALG